MRKRLAEYQRQYRRRHPDKVRTSKTGWRERNPDKVRAASQRYYAKNKSCIKLRVRQWEQSNRDLVRQRGRAKNLQKYGLSEATFGALLASQGRVCAVCRLPDRDWVVDHNHDSGEVRGVLCRQCNMGLGCFRDTPAFLAGAIDYLQKVN
jgi:hypothetical protein